MIRSRPYFESIIEKKNVMKISFVVYFRAV